MNTSQDKKSPPPTDQSGIASNPHSDDSTQESVRDEQMLSLERENQKLLGHLQHERADFANYRKRVEQERKEWMREGQSGAILGVLPIVEHWKRAIAQIPSSLHDDAWVDGIRHIDTLVQAWLQQEEIERMETVDTVFDPLRHEALVQVPGENDRIVAELEPGYVRGNRVLKPAKVALGNGEKNDQEKGSKGSKRIDQGNREDKREAGGEN